MRHLLCETHLQFAISRGGILPCRRPDAEPLELLPADGAEVGGHLDGQPGGGVAEHHVDRAPLKGHPAHKLHRGGGGGATGSEARPRHAGQGGEDGRGRVRVDR